MATPAATIPAARRGAASLRVLPFLVFLFWLFKGVGFAQTGDVTGTVEIVNPDRRASLSKTAPPDVVLWLTPLAAQQPLRTRRYRIVQKDKRFDPHLLVVPVGSSVEFPNQDTFFHNVFSLFDGKRFDLGLYEAGSMRAVQFNHEGISYLFCNIHSEMSAVVIALSTPYFAIASPSGDIAIRNVPPGSYRLAAWTRSANPTELQSLARKIEVAPGPNSIGAIQIHRTTAPETHKNKFGEDYPANPAVAY